METGPDRNKVEKECRESSACDNIRFLGKLEAVEEVLSVADLFILPSESESFGLAALEAMACQVPVISSNTGGIPELNMDGVTGFMSEVGDIAGMAKNALAILSEEDTLLRFKQQALEQASRFDIHRILPLYESLYHRVIGLKS